MKPLLTITAFVLLPGLLIHVSCKKTGEPNTPTRHRQRIINQLLPIQDRIPTRTLPVNNENPGGRSSHDPDNNIDSYLWPKISGPSYYKFIIHH